MNIRTSILSIALSLSMLPVVGFASPAQGTATADSTQQQALSQYHQYPTGNGAAPGPGSEAQQYPADPQQDQQFQYQYQYQAPYQQQYPQSPSYPGHRRRGGRYEQRPVQRWVEGRYQQVWVPEQCTTYSRGQGGWKHNGWRHGGRTVCRPGYYDQRWVPGHYQTVMQWVWVPYRGGRFHIMMRAGGGTDIGNG